MKHADVKIDMRVRFIGDDEEGNVVLIGEADDIYPIGVRFTWGISSCKPEDLREVKLKEQVMSGKDMSEGYEDYKKNIASQLSDDQVAFIREMRELLKKYGQNPKDWSILYRPIRDLGRKGISDDRLGVRGIRTSYDAVDPAKKDFIRKERRVQRSEGHIWKPIPFSEIKKGDIFRLFDGDEPVDNGKFYTAAGEATRGPSGIYAVTIEE